MTARIFTTATLLSFAGILTAKAADTQLLSLVMPDAKVVAGANVDQAKASPFGLYVLTQIQTMNSQGLRQVISMTGFDPTRDVHEVLAATSATAATVDAKKSGLMVARGNFDISRISALAATAKAATETYNGVTIFEDPKQTAGMAFLDATLVVAGGVADVKAAIDRPSSGQALPSSAVTLVNQWSASQDAWIVTLVPPSQLAPPSAAPNLPGIGPNVQGVFQQIQQVGAGVKFGDLVVGTAMAQADTAQNAQQMADALKLLVNLAQMQAGANNPQLTALAQGLIIAAQGNQLKLTLTMPAAQFQQLLAPKRLAAR